MTLAESEVSDPMHDQETHDVMVPATVASEDVNKAMAALVPSGLEIPVLS
jgi:hypothetical protein